ncbi:putative netrin receptor UNC5D-like [Apostichopus japonicus]|uniref:Putative netrin receptor UNC5D-like n=1 Tax=Stichopus japonicus TaxID=307972 RepID=A0A2G8JTB5_STIJA|nr:putative netrin receptor UNC5D-like [Apostichopus japonicus]
MLMFNKEGGRLDIPDTGVSLEIPSGALVEEQFIQMIIIPSHLESESLTFASNSSLVVELLPSNMNLLKPAKLTLPHCLVLKKGCEWKAKIYRSHHKEGSEPQWEEQSNTHYELVFKKDGKPLTISLEKFEPMNWNCSKGINPQVISFEKVAINKGTFCTFVLNRTEPKGTDTCTCLFKAGQAPNLEDYTFLLKAPDLSSAKQPSTSDRQEDERLERSTAGIEASTRPCCDNCYLPGDHHSEQRYGDNSREGRRSSEEPIHQDERPSEVERKPGELHVKKDGLSTSSGLCSK